MPNPTGRVRIIGITIVTTQIPPAQPGGPSTPKDSYRVSAMPISPEGSPRFWAETPGPAVAPGVAGQMTFDLEAPAGLEVGKEYDLVFTPVAAG